MVLALGFEPVGSFPVAGFVPSDAVPGPTHRGEPTSTFRGPPASRDHHGSAVTLHASGRGRWLGRHVSGEPRPLRQVSHNPRNIAIVVTSTDGGAQIFTKPLLP